MGNGLSLKSVVICISACYYYYSYSKCIKGSTHYLSDKQDFGVSSEGLSSGICRAFARNVEILFIA